MQQLTSICLLTCNRKNLSKITIDSLWERLTNAKEFLHLIVVDNNSKDGTVEMLKEYKEKGMIGDLVLLGDGQDVNISNAYNICFKFVKSEYFFCLQDDIRISKLTPDISEQLISLMEKYPEQGTIGARIQHIPSLQINLGNEDLIPARLSISAYFRICKKSDMLKLGENPFSTRDWDDRAMKVQMDKIGKGSSWCRDIWVDHMGHCENRGYPKGYIRSWGWASGNAKIDPRKPYPKIDTETCKPLDGEKVFR
jgi:glycosyltransferase involved in cell wall biosynthesis